MLFELIPMYFNKKIHSPVIINFALLLCLIFCFGNAAAQLPIADFDAPVVKDTKAENRQRLYKSLVSGINKNLSSPLTDSTEENWMDAFYSIELLRYRSPWVEGKLYEAFKAIEIRSGIFQRSLMELVYDAYPNSFEREAEKLLISSSDTKCIAIAAEYLRKKIKKCSTVMLLSIHKQLQQYPGNPVLNVLKLRLYDTISVMPPLKDLLNHTFFTNAKVVFSFQRKNRNYPGITIIRDSTGNFVTDTYGNIFSVTQLARSINNLPGYLSNGNTPEGIFRLYGFDVSRSVFIGPTQNIQLTMPAETSLKNFFKDSTITDSVWTEDWYKKLLPVSWKNYTPFFETLYAGMAGRTEIIAHGTTVDPNYYKGTTYYPLTPTLGCLCTKEIWDEETGKRKQSDQQKLVAALHKAGGADGYYIVIEMDDQQKPVMIEELLPYLK
jgi:hypothetical protein